MQPTPPEPTTVVSVMSTVTTRSWTLAEFLALLGVPSTETFSWFEIQQNSVTLETTT